MSAQELHVWIPSNRRFDNGKPKAMDGLNEIIDDNRAHRNKGARIERENLDWCRMHILRAMRKQGWAPMKTKDSAQPVSVSITFVEVSERRDVPNVVGGGLKYVLDALSRPHYDRYGRITKTGAAAIYDDSTKWVKRIIPAIRIDKQNPGIELTVTREEV